MIASLSAALLLQAAAGYPWIQPPESTAPLAFVDARADVARDVEPASRPHFDRFRDDPAATQSAPAEPSKEWSFSYSAFGYFVPEDHNVLTQTFTADRDWLHLEGRYNYEALDTGSLFVGYNFAFGHDVTFEVTPTVGGVFGETDGLAPGLEALVTWGAFDFYAEAEYVFDAHDHTDNFFYCWSELTWSPTDWLRLGVAAQRTKLYETDVDTQRGPMIAFSWKGFELAAYVFNIGWDTPTVVISGAVDF